jgi:uncharacterized membrane protein
VHKKVDDEYLRWLLGEIDSWQREGIIEPAHADAIRSRYDLLSLRVEERAAPARLTKAVTILGSILLGAGVILFFAANWQAIPKLFKLLILLQGVFSAYHIGFYLAEEKRSYPVLGHGLILLGSILFGASIWLIAQAFHITSRYHNGVLYWALGILPVGYIMGSVPTLILSSGLLSLWGVLKSIYLETTNYAFLIPMLCLIFPICYRLGSRIALVVSVMGVAVWLGVNSSFMMKDFEPILLLYFVFALLVYSFGFTHTGYKPSYQIPAVLMLMGATYILGFKATVGHFLDNPPYQLEEFPWAFSLIALAFLLALIASFILPARKPLISRSFQWEVIGLALMFLLISAFAFVPGESLTTFVILFNLALFIQAIGMVFVGYYNRDSLLVALGFIFFGLGLITRYFDYLWELLPRSLFFILGGIFLLVLGKFLESIRRRIVRSVSEEA